MLSYLKDKADSGLEMIKSGLQKNSTDDEENYLSPAEHGKNLKQSTMILGVLFITAILCLWFMIKKAAPETTIAVTSSQEVEIENALAQITGIRSEVNSQVDNIVGRFCNDSGVEQISVRDLKKNPFKHELSLVDIVDDEEDASVARELFIEEVRNKAKGLQLLSIMESPRGSCCMINDKILYKGGKVEGFTVTAIVNEAVELTLEGVTIKLKISE
jgi:preprotein translocase subunit SecG